MQIIFEGVANGAPNTSFSGCPMTVKDEFLVSNALFNEAKPSFSKKLAP
jgi:hypothetical protein